MGTTKQGSLSSKVDNYLDLQCTDVTLLNQLYHNSYQLKDEAVFSNNNSVRG